MSIDISKEPCAAGGEHGKLSIRPLRPNVSEAYCPRCDLGWSELSALVLDRYVPPKEVAEASLWRGSTYDWQFDGEVWEVYSPAPGGVTLLGDLPLRPMIITYGEPWDAQRHPALNGASR